MEESLKLPELPKQSAVRVWSKSGKFTRGLYENPTRLDREIWALDGDTEEPLLAIADVRSYGLACARAALEEAAKVADSPTIEPHFKDDAATAEMLSDLLKMYFGTVAAAIRNIKVGE